MAKNEAQVESEEDSVDFDANAFLSNIFGTINLYRSQCPISEGVLASSSLNVSGSTSGFESKINAFYRIMGFPAVRGDESLLKESAGALSSVDFVDAASQGGTLNYFKDFPYKDGGLSVGDLTAAREYRLSETPTVQEMLDALAFPLPFAHSLEPTSLARVSIFPLAVNAAVPIFPIARRMAPAFYDGDFVPFGDNRRLTRPFIEHIIYMRTKVYSDSSNDQLVATVKAVESVLAKSEKKGSIIADLKKCNLLEARIVSKLIKSIKECSAEYHDAISRINGLSSDVEFVPSSKPSVNEISGNVSAAISDGLSMGNITEKGLERKILTIEEQIAKEEVFLQLLPSQFISESDSIRRKKDSVLGRMVSVTEDVFLNDFISILENDKNAFIEEKKRCEAEKARKIREFEVQRARLTTLNGEGTGLSIFDVLCVLLALFTVDIDYLYSILNVSSFERLKQNPFFQQNISSAAINGKEPSVLQKYTVQKAMLEIETKVRDGFEIANLYYDKVKSNAAK